MKKMMPEINKKKYTVIGTVTEIPEVTTLYLSCESDMPKHLSGQFITVYLPELGTPEGKAYSISSAPGEQMSITVSARGEFSRRLSALTRGDTFFASVPSGYFYSESNNSTLVLLAGGIGIAPFRSMIIDSTKKNPSRSIHLFYSNRTMDTIVFHKTLEELVSAYPSLKVEHFITREENLPGGITSGRMSAKAIMHTLEKLPEQGGDGDVEREFFICGSISFVRDMWRDLKASGVDEDFLYTEAFFSH